MWNKVWIFNFIRKPFIPFFPLFQLSQWIMFQGGEKKTKLASVNTFLLLWVSTRGDKVEFLEAWTVSVRLACLIEVLRRPAASSIWRGWSHMNTRMFSQTDQLWGRIPLKWLSSPTLQLFSSLPLSSLPVFVSLWGRWKATLAPAVNLLHTWISLWVCVCIDFFSFFFNTGCLNYCFDAA